MTVSTDMLATFVQVAEALNVSRAAGELGVGKSVVSKRIAQLEAAVQATLFSRTTRCVALTPAGETYLDFARRALAEMASGEERLRDLRSELTGQIRLTSSVSWGQRVLAKALPEFLLRHPSIEIELNLADRIVDIAPERVDIALRWTPAPEREFVSEPIERIDWVIAAAPEYLDANGVPLAPADLGEHLCMSYWRDRADDTWRLTTGARLERVRVQGRYHANNPEVVAEAALAGIGIALLPGFLADAAIAEGRLLRVLPAWTPQTRFGDRIFAVATPERMRIARNRALLAFLRARFS